MSRPGIDKNLIGRLNESAADALQSDYEALGQNLARRDIDIDAIKEKAATFQIAVPTSGVTTSATRFARFPIAGEPRNILDKLDDCAVVHQATGVTPLVSLTVPWDQHDDPKELKSYATSRGLAFAAMRSNTYQNAPGQEHSYKFGSLSHTDQAVRSQAVEHNLECIELGRAIGAKALTVWVGDGANLPGQSHVSRAFERYFESLRKIYAGLPDDWRLLIEHRSYDPAFYAGVVPDWGVSYHAASTLGARAFCLVDLGHHMPGVNLEMVLARLIEHGKLGGVRFADSRHGDDRLDAGSADPYRLFLVFNVLAEGERSGAIQFDHLIDQAHTVTDPIESLILSVTEIQRAFVQAQLVDRDVLARYQDANDALMAYESLKQAFRTDVEPILAMARHEKGAAIEPIAAYRESGYRQKVSDARPPLAASATGIT